MPTLSPETKHGIWKRDKFRCRECGVAVAQKSGCLPQTHHVVPSSRRGNDSEDNLATLCFFCHATKESSGHRRLLMDADPKQGPQFVKWALWEAALNLLAYAELLDPRQFPIENTVEHLDSLTHLVERVRERTLDAAGDGLSNVVRSVQFEPVTPERLESMINGVKIGMYSHVAERFYNEKLRQDA